MIDTNDNQSPITTLTLSGPPLPVDLEFKPKPVTDVFRHHGLPMGRCFGSKSAYRTSHPKCDFIPNANVFRRRDGKVWFGDLDLKRDTATLEAIARRLRCRLYVLSEHDGRFHEANRPHAEIIENAVWHTGGPTQIPGVRRFFRRSGLSHADATLLLKLSRGCFNKPQPPKIALEIGRRLREFDRVFGSIASKAGYKRWGLWWTRPTHKLAGESPLQILKSGKTLDFGDLTEASIGLALFAIRDGVTEKI